MRQLDELHPIDDVAEPRRAGGDVKNAATLFCATQLQRVRGDVRKGRSIFGEPGDLLRCMLDVEKGRSIFGERGDLVRRVRDRG